MWCGYYRGQGILWRSFKGTTYKTADEYKVCSSAQAVLSQYLWRRLWCRPGPQTQQPPNSQWTLPFGLQKSVVHTFTGGPRGKNDIEAPHISDGIFMFYFIENITLHVAETDRYHLCMDSLDDGPSPQPDVAEAKMFVFPAIKMQMGHCLRDQLTDCWEIMDQFYSPFYSNIMSWNRYLHMLFCISRTTEMELTGWMKIMTGYGKYRTYLKF